MNLKKFRKKILEYADSLEATNAELAEKIRSKVDELVSWYKENQREMHMDEFTKILHGSREKKGS